MEIESLLLFAWVAIMAVQEQKHYREEVVLGENEYRIQPSFAFWVFLPIFIFCVYGRMRSDTYAYMLNYRLMPTSLESIKMYVAASESPGFAVFSIIIKLLSRGSETAYRFVIALIHSIPLIYVFRKYSEKYVFTIYLFLASTMHLAWMTNGLRQFIAVTLVFATTPWIIEKKYVKTILVILLASTFHQTALVMIPIVFIVQGEIWNRKTILFSIAAVVATVLFSRNTSMFDNIAASAGYSLEAAREFGDDGANPIRVLFNAVPMILAFTYRRDLRVVNNPIINICVNMSVITTGVYLIAMVTSGIMVGRMPIYTSLYNLILLPYLIDYCMTSRNKGMIKLCFVGAYFAFYVYSVI